MRYSETILSSRICDMNVRATAAVADRGSTRAAPSSVSFALEEWHNHCATLKSDSEREQEKTAPNRESHSITSTSKENGTMLRSVNDLAGYSIEASDGEIGSAVEFYF